MAGSTACSLEQLIAAETSKGLKDSRMCFFYITLDNTYFLVQHSSLPKENYSTLRVLELFVILGYTFSKSEHEGFKDTQEKVEYYAKIPHVPFQKWHPLPCLLSCLRQWCPELAGWRPIISVPGSFQGCHVYTWTDLKMKKIDGAGWGGACCNVISGWLW